MQNNLSLPLKWLNKHTSHTIMSSSLDNLASYSPSSLSSDVEELGLYLQ